MWGKILIGIGLMSLLYCQGSAITCDPSLANPGCPERRICDPTGICQLQCSTDNGCTDAGFGVCDLSSGLTLCQMNCVAPPTSGLCPTGQTCVNYNRDVPTGSTNIQTFSQQTCKLLCNSQNDCGVGFMCLKKEDGNQYYCWKSSS